MTSVQRLKTVPYIKSPFSAKTYKYIEINGHKYSDGTVFLLHLNQNNEPQFGKLRTIYEIKGNIYFFVCTLQEVAFDDHYHAFHVYDNDKPDTLIHMQRVPRTVPCLFVKKESNYYIASRFDM